MKNQPIMAEEKDPWWRFSSVAPGSTVHTKLRGLLVGRVSLHMHREPAGRGPTIGDVHPPQTPGPTFDKANNDHDEPPIVVMVVGMVDPSGNLANPDHLLHGHENELDREEADALVEEVQGAVEDQVPGRAEGDAWCFHARQFS